jgi:NAD(P)-dependent dehydrogenase (short-subunit alcohol dehydrogenase family)
MAYSVTKAAQLHLMRCLAQTQGPKARVNAVLPGLLLTEWVRQSSSSLPNAADVVKGPLVFP